jgi:pyrroline-5-carboxylate reductase
MIGAGNMGYTFAEGMAGSPFLNQRKLMIHDRNAATLSRLEATEHFAVYGALEECLPLADIVFIAVKPYHCEELFRNMRPLVNQGQIFVSMMAGVTIESIQRLLGVQKVIRSMPNLPAKVGKGVTSFTEAPSVTRVESHMVRNLLDTTGVAIHVDSEDFIDKSTGISGSGPAYVFYFMQSMLEAAQKMGFSNHDAKVLVTNTFEGAITLFRDSDLSPTGWMDRVASKGGTTEAALESMEDNNVKELIKDAALAAFQRAVDLGNESSLVKS